MNIPMLLITLRFLFAPLIIGLAYFKGVESTFAITILMLLGLLSDILDGIVARYQNISSEKLRRLDSQVDMVFWLSIGIATWLIYPRLIQENSIPIRFILIMEGMCYVISLVKFGKETCSHAFLSKLWGISLFIAFASLLGFNHAGLPFQMAIILGVVSHVDRMLITLILPKWTHDIPSAYHAYLIRKKIPFKRNKYLNG